MGLRSWSWSLCHLCPWSCFWTYHASPWFEVMSRHVFWFVTGLAGVSQSRHGISGFEIMSQSWVCGSDSDLSSHLCLYSRSHSWPRHVSTRFLVALLVSLWSICCGPDLGATCLVCFCVLFLLLCLLIRCCVYALSLVPQVQDVALIPVDQKARIEAKMCTAGAYSHPHTVILLVVFKCCTSRLVMELPAKVLNCYFVNSFSTSTVG